ncbi:unnamed protein product [Somion occarium]|uniref:Uncharacterized protein n=1 Tax=Somion occarium TaxID=3059160 RepID=A0ABP1DKZ9_9APHY
MISICRFNRILTQYNTSTSELSIPAGNRDPECTHLRIRKIPAHDPHPLVFVHFAIAGVSSCGTGRQSFGLSDGCFTASASQFFFHSTSVNVSRDIRLRYRLCPSYPTKCVSNFLPLVLLRPNGKPMTMPSSPSKCDGGQDVQAL